MNKIVYATIGACVGAAVLGVISYRIGTKKQAEKGRALKEEFVSTFYDTCADDPDKKEAALNTLVMTMATMGVQHGIGIPDLSDKKEKKD